MVAFLGQVRPARRRVADFAMWWKSNENAPDVQLSYEEVFDGTVREALDQNNEIPPFRLEGVAALMLESSSRFLSAMGVKARPDHRVD